MEELTYSCSSQKKSGYDITFHCHKITIFHDQSFTFIGGGCCRKAAAEESVELLGPALTPGECRDSGFGCKSLVTGITGTAANEAVAALRFCGKTCSERSIEG